MSPIRPENKAKYPGDWTAISLRIKERAGWRCECEGECGKHHIDDWPESGRCVLKHGDTRPHNPAGRLITLTTAHLDHDPANCADENLKAMCEGCHNRYDLPMRVANRRKRLAEQAGQGVLL